MRFNIPSNGRLAVLSVAKAGSSKGSGGMERGLGSKEKGSKIFMNVPIAQLNHQMFEADNSIDILIHMVSIEREA